ncbi:hypothetical protein N0V90_002240 [Kalmusia sp. IMI 367209]|nr:hypothetical protein N0V90_002240 [Kalmusia sp. IMI 367209]
MDKPDPVLPERLWNALSQLTHIVSREDTEPPLQHQRPQSYSSQLIASASSQSPNPSNNKPVFLLLHGAWHLPTCFSRLISQLHARGYPTLAPHLPSSGANPPLRTWDPDIEVIRASVTRLARDEVRDIVVVMHAHAGLAGTQALSGLDKKSCTAQGWSGGVIRLIYICAFMFPENWTQLPPGTGDGLDPNITVDLARGIYYVAPPNVKAMMYQDVPDAEVEEIARGLVPQSLAVNWCTSTFAAWRWIPTTYVLTLRDQAATVRAEEWIVKNAMESGECAVDRVVRREVGHSPFWSQAEWTAGMLIEEAERSVKG